MAINTENYRYIKQDEDDFYDINQFNENMDMIDEDMKKRAEEIKSHTHNYAGSASVGGAATTAELCTGNAATATKATQDSAGQQINFTYIKNLSVSGKTMTVTKGDSTTSSMTTQDTTYSAGTGLSLSGTTFNHSNSIASGTAQGDVTKTLTFGGTFTVPTVSYDAQGHITSTGTTTMTMPAATTANLTFIYNCTGTADSTAIATIINNFFNSGTAMTMNLIVTGTMGVAFTSTYYAMYINAANSRGAVCNVDFSDCYIPTITTATRDFLYLYSATAKLNVIGLVVKTTRYPICCNTTSYCSFTNCKFTTTTSGSGLYMDSTSSYNTFLNCSFNTTMGGSYYMAYIIGNHYSFIGCNFANTANTTNPIYITGKCNHFIDCNMQLYSSASGIQIYGDNNVFESCRIYYTVSSGVGSAINFRDSSGSIFSNCYVSYSGGFSGGFSSYGVQTAATGIRFTFDGCTFISSVSSSTATADWGWCVNITAASSGTFNFTNCRMINNTGSAIYCATSNTSTVIKVTGCEIYSSSEYYSDIYNIYQSTAASTVKWYIVGNSFNKSSIRVNGTSDITSATASNYIYFPAYANYFNQAIS